MSAGNETYVANAFKAGQLVEEMWTYDGITSREIETLYKRNPLATGGYDIIYNKTSAAVPDVTIVSVTQPAVETEDVTVVATTPAGTLSYKFEIEFSTNNWLTIQDGPSNAWTVPANSEGFFWRVVVTADDGTTTDSQTFNSPGRIEGVATGPVQTLTWTMTAANKATFSGMSGVHVVDVNRTSGLTFSSGQLRFWNGDHALNYGANLVSGKYQFGSGALSTAWWEDNWQARVRMDYGSGFGQWFICDDKNNLGTIYTGGSSSQYNNIGTNFGNVWPVPYVTALSAGDVMEIEIYAKGNLP